ncbi:MAG TPA: hypothetical protein PLE30_10260 [Candidatus Kapabacteria bacterium]|nr:hypothetical protein [Candidatus Kapabacteria bacterium]
MSGYVSKDFIHNGCGLNIDPELVWNNIPYSVKKNIRKAERNDVIVIRKEGNEEDLNVLRNMWYDPQDPNLPSRLKPEDIMYIAYLGNSPIGSIILLPVGRHLFLNNLAANELGKENRAQDYLLWYVVNDLKNSQYTYIDVGVSYRKNLYDFFIKWHTFNYPVIFNKPKINNPINLDPFEKTHDYENTALKYKESEELLIELVKSNKFTFVPNIDIAKNICSIENLNYIDATFNHSVIDDSAIFIIDLPKIFSTQFGALIINLKIEDTVMWNKYRSLDVFKREFVYLSINNELKSLPTIIHKRNENYQYIERLFQIDGIKGLDKKETIRSYFYFSDINNQQYSFKLNEFNIEHLFDKTSNTIALPIHQNLNISQLNLIYGIYRGILNLCSEWVHTDYYSDIK